MRIKFTIAVALYWFFAANLSMAQEHTIGWFLNSEDAFNGYTLFAPNSNNETYLIDNCGKNIHSWSSDYKPGLSTYLFEDGKLLRTGNVNNQTFIDGGGRGGIIERIDENNEITWSYEISDNGQCQHHDIEMLPNGNILVIVWDLKTAAEAIAAGRNPATVETSLWSEKIIEIEPVGTNEANIVWEWYVWDHLIQDFDETQNNYGVVADHSELMNLNFYLGNQFTDWLHINSVDYNSELDQIILSAHNTYEVWIIDHSTTTEEAAGNSGGNSGMGGDFLFRWGNPRAYQKGSVADQMFFAQHDARWVEATYPDEGKITVFNNGQNRPDGNYSSVDAIEAVIDDDGYYTKSDEGTYQPENLSWQYIADNLTSFYSSNISGAEQMPNGNLLICEGASGHFFEVDLDGNLFWEYINPVSINGPLEQGDQPGGSPPDGNPNGVFRIKRYAADYVGLQNYNLEPGDPIEVNPLDYNCETYTVGIENSMSNKEDLRCYPNPASDYITVALNKGNPEISKLQILNLHGEVVYSKSENIFTEKTIHIGDFKPGLYFIRLELNDAVILKKFIKKS